MPKTITRDVPQRRQYEVTDRCRRRSARRIQAESNTAAGNGEKYYANRYHFYFLFEGDRIAQVRDYNDVNLVAKSFSARRYTNRIHLDLSDFK
jgi:hypothetical protein